MAIEQIELAAVAAAVTAAVAADERYSAVMEALTEALTDALHPSGFCFCAANTAEKAGLVEEDRLLESGIEEAGIKKLDKHDFEQFCEELTWRRCHRRRRRLSIYELTSSRSIVYL